MQLVERQATRIAPILAEKLLYDGTFIRLINEGIVETSFGKGGSMTVKASKYVGRTILSSGATLEIKEKIPGALAGMIPWICPAELKELLLKSPSTDGGELIAIVVARFLESVADYLRGGRRKAYIREEQFLSSPSGKLNVPAIIRSRAKGVRTRIACHPNTLSGRLNINALIALSLFCVDALEGHPYVDKKSISRARFLMPYFTEYDYRLLRSASHEELQRQFAQEVAVAGRTNVELKALTYGRPLAIHAMSAFGGAPLSEIPSSFFINLESLFEDSALACLKDCVGFASAQGPSEFQKKSIFGGAAYSYIAKPDVIWPVSSDCRAIFDCKYKEIDGHPANADVYQILVHAQTYESKIAILLYPSSGYSVKTMGVFQSDVHLYLASIRCHCIREDIELLTGQIKEIANSMKVQ